MEGKVVTLLKNCYFHNLKIMEHFANIFDCIKHHDVYNDLAYGGDYYYAHNIENIVKIVRRILNEQRA